MCLGRFLLFFRRFRADRPQGFFAWCRCNLAHRRCAATGLLRVRYSLIPATRGLLRSPTYPLRKIQVKGRRQAPKFATTENKFQGEIVISFVYRLDLFD